MVAPAAVDNAQHHSALKFPHYLFAQLCLTTVVSDCHVGENFLHHILNGGAKPQFVEEFIDGDANRIQSLQLRPQLVQVPLFGDAVFQVVVHNRGDGSLNKFAHPLGDVIAFEDLASVVVNRLALTV